jgi:RimJ/RimL family protein N-acetyltransferase
VEAFLADKHQIRKCEAGVTDGNDAMVRPLERLDYEQEGARSNHFIVDGQALRLGLFGKTIVCES